MLVSILLQKLFNFYPKKIRTNAVICYKKYNIIRACELKVLLNLSYQKKLLNTICSEVIL